MAVEQQISKCYIDVETESSENVEFVIYSEDFHIT